MALPDLRGNDLDDYYAALKSSHRFRIRLEVYNSDDELLERYDEDDLPIIEGQVDVDDSADIERQLRLTLANTIESSTSPTNPGSAVTPERQVRINYDVLVAFRDGTEDWVEVPVFHGPVTRVLRDAFTVQIEAQSKEAYLLPPSRLLRSVIPQDEATRTVNTVDGERVVTIEEDHKVESYYAGHLIKRIAKRHGERKMRIPRTDRKLPETSKIFDKASQEKGVWPLLKQIAGAQQLLYTGDGHLTLRTRRHRNPRYVFNDGANGEVLSVPAVEWDMTTFRNTLELRAFQKKQGNEKENPTLRVKVNLERSHPLSARNLERNGTPRELLEVVETDDVYPNAGTARKDAKRLLARLAHNGQSVSFDALPIPHLEPGDLAALDVAGKPRVHFVVHKFSLPLTPASMSVGYNRRVR